MTLQLVHDLDQLPAICRLLYIRLKENAQQPQVQHFQQLENPKSRQHNLFCTKMKMNLT